MSQCQEKPNINKISSQLVSKRDNRYEDAQQFYDYNLNWQNKV